jgi:hypothetical protein
MPTLTYTLRKTSRSSSPRTCVTQCAPHDGTLPLIAIGKSNSLTQFSIGEKMNTYFLTGNPTKPETEGGMRRAYFDQCARDFRSGGSVERHWTFYDHKSVSGDQVVLYRAGPTPRKANLIRSGIIAFGHRLPGDSQGGFKDRQEYPVVFTNLHWGNEEEPFIWRGAMKQHGIWPSNNFQSGGMVAEDEVVAALNAYCVSNLGASLADLCTKRINLS